MIDVSVLERISNEANVLLQKDMTEENKLNLINLFYSLMEALGYSIDMQLTPGLYAENDEETFDIAYKTDPYDDASVNMYTKIIEPGANLNEYEDIVFSTATIEGGFGNNQSKYFIIYNLFAFKIYVCSPGETSLININSDIQIIQMNNLKESIEYLEMLSVSNFEPTKEELEEEEENNVEPINEKEPKEKKQLDKNALTKIAMIIGAIIIILLILSFLFGGNNDETPQKENNNDNISQTTIVNNEITENTNKSSINLNTDDSSSESYLTIKGVLDLSVENEKLSINLISDLPEEAIVKLGIFCGDEVKYDYIRVDKNGKGSYSYEIPSTWGEEQITVGAYLKFTEDGYKQPDNVTKKFGESGEYISWNKDYSKDMITYSTTTHSNALVKALKEKAEKERLAKLMNTIEKDFASVDTRVDKFGNIKHVPKGYSFDETNISEKVNIYPMIYYDAKSETSYFYIICGYVGTQFYRFEKVGFTADGYNWTYENSTNEKKNQIVGNKKAEWIYFNNVDSNVLLGDMDLFCNSNEVSMSIIGSVNKTYDIRQEELDNIKLFLYIYKTYYGNGTTVPDTSWFNMAGTSVTLNYIENPTAMYERGYKEIESLNEYSNSLSEKRLNGQTVTADEATLLETMNMTYRRTSSTIYNKIMDMIKNSTDVTSTFYDDYETNKKYMKIYFEYNTSGDIESGYIPYINIYDDLTVLVPIKTISSSTTTTDKVYATFKISQSLYDELSTYYNSINYEQIN